MACSQLKAPKCAGRADGLKDSFWPFYGSEMFMLWRLRSLTGCAVGVWPRRSPQRCPAADLPVLSADSVSQDPPIQKAIRVNLCKHTRRKSLEKCLDSYWTAKHEQQNNLWKWKETCVVLISWQILKSTYHQLSWFSFTSYLCVCVIRMFTPVMFSTVQVLLPQGFSS